MKCLKKNKKKKKKIFLWEKKKSLKKKKKKKDKCIRQIHITLKRLFFKEFLILRLLL